MNTAYEFIGVVEEAESILWNKKYNDIGEAEIYVPCNDTYLELLQRGHFLYRYDDDMFCRIETVEIETDAENGDYIIARAKDICTILARRIVCLKTVFSGLVYSFIFRLLNDNVASPLLPQRKIDITGTLAGERADYTETIETSVLGEDLLELIISTCKTYNYGFRVYYDLEQRRLVFKLYKGVNKATTASESYIEFSPDYANIISSNYKESDENYKNVAYVSYKNAEEVIYFLTVYKGVTEPQGEARREIFVDGTGTSRDITLDELRAVFPSYNVLRQPATQTTEKQGYYYIDNSTNTHVANFEITETDGVKEEKLTVTDYTYKILIRLIGETRLAECTRTQEFTGVIDTIDNYEYKADYDLGDVVKVINEYGIEAEARITEIMESEDNEDGYTVEPTFEYLS